MRIPEIRQRLFEIGLELRNREIITLAQELIRRAPARKRAPPRRGPLTLGQITAIRVFADAHPELGQQEIAAHFRTQNGRVSEALGGYRK